MAEPLLSICIPTYNRAGFIGETLDSILEQATDLEIVIVDGASQDDTAGIVAEYQRRFPLIRYFRRETNVGVDRDIHESVARATGEYCWLMSSDDLLRPGAIAAVAAVAAGRRHDLIVVDSEIRTSDLVTVLEPSRLRLSHDQEFAVHETEDLFRTVAGYLSFMGGVVIRREVWMNRIREHYFGTEFVHLGVIFGLDEPLRSAAVLSKPWIWIRYSNATWADRAFEIWTFKWPRLIWSFEHLPPAARGHVVPREPWYDPASLLYRRALGAYSSGVYARWIRPLPGSGMRKMIARVIAAVPAAFVNAAAVLWGQLSRRYAGATLFDLRESPYYLPKRLRRLLNAR